MISMSGDDGGPFIKGRIIDLTRASFSKIGHIGKGTIKVKLEVVEQFYH